MTSYLKAIAEPVAAELREYHEKQDAQRNRELLKSAASLLHEMLDSMSEGQRARATYIIRRVRV